MEAQEKKPEISLAMLDLSKLSPGRIGSNVPEGYRLSQKADGSIVLQGCYTWREVDGSGAGVEWKDVPTHVEQTAPEPERKGCVNCGTLCCDRQTAYECGKEGMKWTPRKLEPQAVKLQQDLHGAIMNLPCNVPGTVAALGDNAVEMYKIAHRDARHQAAELALKYEKK